MAKQYRSDALASIHETMAALHEVGTIDKLTMREFDDTCLTSVEPLSPEAIRALLRRRSSLDYRMNGAKASMTTARPA